MRISQIHTHVYWDLTLRKEHFLMYIFWKRSFLEYREKGCKTIIKGLFKCFHLMNKKCAVLTLKSPEWEGANFNLSHKHVKILFTSENISKLFFSANIVFFFFSTICCNSKLFSKMAALYCNGFWHLKSYR